ncbi:MAG: ArsR/SmtB family transcription factor [Betaproteobacteria bacterium]
MFATVDRHFTALADPSRRAIFETLARAPLAVGELAVRFPISRPAVSQHLRVLADANLVAHERRGTQNVYRVNPEGLETLRRYLDAMWSRALPDFKRIAESSYQKSRKERS